MTDMEKVIKALECCATDDVNWCDNCPYLGCSPDRYCFGNMAADALALLKAQERDITDMRNDLRDTLAENLRLSDLLKAQEPVVRCGNCEHSYFASNRTPDEQCWVCGKHGIDVTPDWFCADGERRDEDGKDA